MKAGISTSCFYPTHTEDAVRWLTERQVPQIEIFFNSMAETEPTFLRSLRQQLWLAGCRVVSVHPFLSGLEPMLFFSGYDRRQAEGMEIYRHFFEAAAFLGAKILVFHGERAGSARPDEQVFDAFGQLALLGRSFGITVTQENVVRCKSGSAAYLKQMKDWLGPLATFTLDVKQARRRGERPEDFVILLGDSIRHVHISDGGPAGDCLPVGRGEEDLLGLLHLLRQQGFDGGVMMELYRDNYRDGEELLDSFRILEGLVEKAKNPSDTSDKT